MATHLLGYTGFGGVHFPIGLSLINTTATDHQEPHPHPNPPPEVEGILWGFSPAWGRFYWFFPLSWDFFQFLPFQEGGQEGDGIYMSL